MGNSPNTGANVTAIGAKNCTLINSTAIGVQKITYADKVAVGDIQKDTRDNIHLWTQDTVEPAVVPKILEKIRTSACVTITGSPGEGKSTLGYWVLRKLQGTRNVYEVRSPGQFVEVIKTSAPVILLDDIFGQTVFDEAAWKEWKSVIGNIMIKTELKSNNKIVNIILIAREFVLKSGSRHTEHLWKMLVEHVVNINGRTNEEKVNLVISICKRYDVHLDTHTIKTICSIKTPHGFPHTCKLFLTLFKKDSRISAVEFFYKPLQFLQESLKILVTNEVIEHILMEMIKGNGHVLKCEISKCGSNFIRTANDLCPTYIKPDGNCYVFDHPSIMDTVALLMCETKLPFILEHCSMEFIRERVWLETTDGKKRSETEAGAKLMVNIPLNEAKELVTRFVKEIAKGNLVDVVYHNAWDSHSFVMLMLESLTVDQLNVRGGVILLHQLCAENRADCVKMCVQRGAVIRQGGFGRTPLHEAAILGCTASARVLLEFGVDVNVRDKEGRTALDLATQFENRETASVISDNLTLGDRFTSQTTKL